MAWTEAMRRKAAITRRRNAKEKRQLAKAARKFPKVTRGSMPLALVPAPVASAAKTRAASPNKDRYAIAMALVRIIERLL